MGGQGVKRACCHVVTVATVHHSVGVEYFGGFNVQQLSLERPQCGAD